MSETSRRVIETAAAIRVAAARRRGVAVRATLCVALPLLIGYVTGHPEAGAQASFGGLAGVYVPDSPFWYQGRVVAAVGVGLVLMVFLGALAGGQGWFVAAAAAGLAAAIASFLCQAAELPPPRELLLVMAVLAATEIPADLQGALSRALLTVAGAVGAWVISMAPLVLGFRNPEIRTLAAGLASIAGLLDAMGTDAEAAARHSAVLAVRRRSVDAASSWHRPRPRDR